MYQTESSFVTVIQPTGARIYNTDLIVNASGLTGANTALTSSGFTSIKTIFNATYPSWATIPSYNPFDYGGYSNDWITTGAVITGDVNTVVGLPCHDGRSEATGLTSNTSYTNVPFVVFQGGGNFFTGRVPATKNVGIGTTSASNNTNYYGVDFTTLKTEHQFQTNLTPNTGDFNKTATGSGILKRRSVDVTLNLTDRMGKQLASSQEFANNPWFKEYNASILNSTGAEHDQHIAFPNFKSGYRQRTLTVSQEDNKDIFGQWTGEYGIRFEVNATDGKTATTEFYLYSNQLEIENITVLASGGLFRNESFNNFINSGTSTGYTGFSDLMAFTSRKMIESGSPNTGSIVFIINNRTDPRFTKFKGYDVYAEPTESFDISPSNFLGHFPARQGRVQSSIYITQDHISDNQASDNADQNINYESGHYFKIVPKSTTNTGTTWCVGPYSLEPHEISEETFADRNEVILDSGNQQLSGQLRCSGLQVQNFNENNLTIFDVDVHNHHTNVSGSFNVSGYITGECLSITHDSDGYPITLLTKDEQVAIGTPNSRASTSIASKLDVHGNASFGANYAGATAAPTNGMIVEGTVGIGTQNPLTSDDSKLHVWGNTMGSGAGNRLTGPGGKPYLLTGDAGGGAAAVTLQTATDNGKTTTNDISVGTSITPTAPLTIKTDSSDDAGVDIYADGDTSNRILTLKADSNNAGEIIVKDTAGVDSVKLSNTSSRGQADFYDAGGTARMTLVVDGNSQGKMTLLDSSANESIVLSSDSNKRGKMDVYDAGGDSVVEIKADSSDEGVMSIKDAIGVVQTIVQAHKSILSASNSNIYSTGSVIVGGSGHIISGDYDAIAGGADNQISGIGGDFNFIGGGSGVDISESKFASSVGGENNDIITGNYSVIAGGKNNLISGDGVSDNNNFIGGGSANAIKGTNAGVVVGGTANEIVSVSGVNPEYAVIGGGANNKIYHGYSFIGGGEEHKVHKQFGAILGGEVNISSGVGAVIAGGTANAGMGETSFIGGGLRNTASGSYSFIGGGEGNQASGKHSYAFGRKALIPPSHSGAAVLADGQNRVHASNGEHTLTLDFASGVYLPTGSLNIPSGGLFISGNPVMTGSHTVEADTLQTVTDRGASTTKAVTIDNQLIVSGNITGFSAIITGGTTLSGSTMASGTLDVSGKTTINNDLTVDAGTLFADAANNKVGVGTASSLSSKLDVYGNISVGGDGNYAGSTPAPTDGMIIKGTVGIGTTSPASQSNLHVYGSGIIGGSYSSAPADGLAVVGKVGIGTNVAGSKVDVNGNVAIGSAFLGYAAPSNGLAVAGNVGIGTYSVNNALDIYGAALIGQNYSSSAITAPSNGLIVEGNVGVGTSNPRTKLDVRGTISGYTGLFDDKVGIGTNSPQAALDVARDTDASGIIGRAQIGYVGDSDFASFAHVDFANATDYAFAQTSAGHSVINARDGYNIYVREGDANIAVFDGSTKDFYVDTDTLYVDASEDSVGIGTAAPATNLDVRGTTLLSGDSVVSGDFEVYGKNTVSGNSNFSGNISGYTGFFSGVQIGVTGHYNHVPSELLEVQPNDDVSAEIGQAHVGYVGHSNYAGFSHIDHNTTTNYALLQASAGSTYLNSKASQNIYFLQGGSVKGGFNTSNDFYIDTDTLYVDASEDSVGINTSAPTQELDVRGTTLLSGQAIVDGGASVSSSATLHVRQKGNAATDGIALTSSNATSHRIWKDSAGTLNIGPSTNTDAFVQDLNGNVGILTNAPSTALDVRGTISGYTGLFNAAQIGATGGGLYPLEIVATANNQDLIRLSHPSSPDVAGFMIGFTNDGAGDNNNATLGVEYGGTDYDVIDIQRSTRNVAIDGDTLYVDSADDRVGVGTNNPSYTLEVTESDASSLLSRFYNTSTTNGQGILVRAGETSNANRILQLASRDDTKVMTVNSNGRVGIGADTTPDYNLDLGGDTSSTSNTFRINQNDGGTAIRIGAGGGSSDVTLLRVDGESTQHNGESDKSNFGFSLNYMGSRSSNANSLSLFCDDGGATNQVEGLTVTQEGQLGILDTSITGYASADLALTVGGPAQVMGHFSATSKSFLIDHPTKENKKLQYASLEGPEHGVFVRGTTNKNIIKLPDYWKDLVHEDSITVTLTPLHTFQSLYVKSKTPEQIMVGGVEKSYDYVVYGERKDIDKLEVEI